MTSPSDLQEAQAGKQGKRKKKGGKPQDYNGDLCVAELGWAAFVPKS